MFRREIMGPIVDRQVRVGSEGDVEDRGYCELDHVAKNARMKLKADFCFGLNNQFAC
jgi:hypothetical protein